MANNTKAVHSKQKTAVNVRSDFENGIQKGNAWAEKLKSSRFAKALRTFFSVPLVKTTIKWVILPAVFYWVIYYLMNPGYWGNFSKLFFIDSGDGFQNVWNIWWVNHSMVDLGQNPYFTTFLHFPHGTQLITQTMNIFNGLVGIPLQGLGMNLIETVNWAVVFSFVAGGMTMFWLAYYLGRSYPIALFAGFLFTFSSYHFAHAVGHLQLVSLEWLPLFLLAFWALLNKWRYWLALAAAGSLFLVILCDYYYFFYCILAGAILLAYKLIARQIRLDMHKVKVLAVFVVASTLLTGPFVAGLVLVSTVGGPLLGSHPADMFGTDIFAPFVPGGSWYWHDLTAGYWERLPGYFAETSVYLGAVVIVSVVVALFRRKWFKFPKWINGWWLVFFVFAALALGPHLRVLGKMLPVLPLPYAFAAKVFPPLQMSGVPVRMMIVVLLAGIIISLFVLKKINFASNKGKALFVALLMLSFIELYPRPLPLTDPSQPEYVTVLKNLELKPGSGIIDNAAISAPHALYAQTEHQKPMAFGYVTRTQQSVDNASFHVFAAIEENRQNELCSRFKIRYFATQVYYNNGFPIIYQDDKSPAHIYDLKNSENC